MPALRILYRDEHVAAVDKPSGLLMHRSRIARDRVFAMQEARQALGQPVFPAHRLDRPTSGVLLFALDPQTANALRALWDGGTVRKRYLAIVRGYPPEACRVEHALREEESGIVREAITLCARLATAELPEPMPPHATTRCALVGAEPLTGRTHQVRRHLAHISHPVIGDTQHGDGRHNRLFRERYGIDRLLLHAHALELPHPVSGAPLRITAPLPVEFRFLCQTFGWPEP
jgi:tRNA pseudouridine65 synthase